jgi:predicted ATPase
MRIKRIHAVGFRRFTDLTISNLSPTARLVVLTGPNGYGKSSLFDFFLAWHMQNNGYGSADDASYYTKTTLERRHPEIEFYTDFPIERRKTFYARSAYRNDPSFSVDRITRSGPPLEELRFRKMIENDVAVSKNYERLVSQTVQSLYGGMNDDISVSELRDKLIGQVRGSMARVFGDLVLTGIGRPLEGGAFEFAKGTVKDFNYKNLSGGEKAAFDLLLDLVLKRDHFDDTVYCIDEPDLHMHTSLQGKLLQELFDLVPNNCQLWIATHSMGMMRKARDLAAAHPGEVIFLDFERDFDEVTELTPSEPNREFWARSLRVALDDLAGLVAPSTIVLCEGKPTHGDSNAQFDAQCYRAIFGTQYPDTDFLSVGSSIQVARDHADIGAGIRTLVPGTKVIRLIDRDELNDVEIEAHRGDGVAILSRRHLEAFLMADDVLVALCAKERRSELATEVIAARASALAANVGRGKPTDDFKAAAQDFFQAAKRILQLQRAGSTKAAFLRDTVAPLLRPGMPSYEELKKCVFGVAP